MSINRRNLVSTAIAIPLMPALARSGSLTAHASQTDAEFGAASERLREMLDLSPLSTSQDILEILWTDYERQYAENQDRSDADFTRIAMPLGSTSLEDYFLEEFESTLGFTFDQVKQSIHFGQDVLTSRVLTMDADISSMPDAWEAGGWQPIESHAGTIWSVSDDGDWSDPQLNRVQYKLVASGFGNMSILDEETIASADSPSALENVMLTHQNAQDPVTPELEVLMAGIPDRAISAWFLDGRVFEPLDVEENPGGMDHIHQSDAAVGPMPAIKAAVLGYTAGFAQLVDQPQEDERVYFLFESSELGQSEQIVKVIQWRVENLPSLVTSEPYVNLFDLLEYEVVNEDVAIVKANSLGDGQEELFAKMLEGGDITPFMYIP